MHSIKYLFGILILHFGMFGIRGRVKIEWILDAFNKVFIWDFNPFILFTLR